MAFAGRINQNKTRSQSLIADWSVIVDLSGVMTTGDTTIIVIAIGVEAGISSALTTTCQEIVIETRATETEKIKHAGAAENNDELEAASVFQSPQYLSMRQSHQNLDLLPPL